jgi:hypothetical protein
MHHVNVNVPLFILIFGLQSDEEIFEAIRGGSPDGHYVEEELGCAYECYRLGIYDRPSAMCYLMENTSLTEYLASIATMKPTSTKLSRR